MRIITYLHTSDSLYITNIISHTYINRITSNPQTSPVLVIQQKNEHRNVTTTSPKI